MVDPAAHPLIRLEGAVQHYAWGGNRFLPDLLGRPNPDGRPWAELWLGAHPSAPALAVLGEGSERLDRLVAGDPRRVLGPRAAAMLDGRLPYLLKVLDARRMLSLQAHPSRAQAAEGWARENAAGVPLDAPQRCYRDDNHKPEVHVALTDFWMLHGFRPLEAVASEMRRTPEVGALMPEFGERLRAARGPAERRSLLRDLYARVMGMPQERVDALLGSLLARTRAEVGDPDARGHWALRAAEEYALPGGRRDRGIFSIYLLNLVRLRPGEGTYQPAGTLHAYLKGANVEMMASSDNVLRGGLTPKHVDAPELLRTLDFGDGEPEVLRGEPAGGGERVYRTAAEEFELSRIELAPGAMRHLRAEAGPDSLIVVEGAAEARSGAVALPLPRGTALFVPHGVAYSLGAGSAPAVLFRGAVPLPRA
ncbi:MAG TPA: mannose-6-phosphate isomerase, class I [Chthonomonadales bacterium]|nr:mannose-6-phosphate isomerase, class I [Chthonomonadales bacterium]